MTRSLVLPPQQIDRIEKILDELQSKTRATYVFVADISGQLIHVHGRVGSSNVVALAALTASNVAATSEMARMIGEPERFRMLLHEGQRENIYLSHVGDSFLLAVIFDAGVQIGLIRLFTKRAVEELAALSVDFETYLKDSAILGEEFRQALDDELGRIMTG